MNYQQFIIVILLWISSELLIMNVIQAEKTQDPFYIIAHMANNIKSVNWAVSQGANGIESDFQFNDDGQPTMVEHGFPCDCTCTGVTTSNICRQGLKRKCAGPQASNNAATHLQHVAQLKDVALYIIDPKLKARWHGKLINAGKAIIPFIDKNLFDYGYKGKVIIGSSKVNTYSYIEAATIAANSSTNRDRYYFTFDGAGNDYQGVISTLSRLTNHRVYGTGISSCGGKTFYDAIENGVNGKAKGENGMTYIWTLDAESSMENYINRGVQGIITNRVGVAKQIVESMGLTMAKPSTPIPISNAPISSIDKCDCDYHPGGCIISWPAPSGKACKCRYKFLQWTCAGSLVSCDKSHPKCSKPDESKEACQLGQGDCDGY